MAKRNTGPKRRRPTEHDVALILGRTPDQEGVHVLRHRPDRMEMGTLRPLKEGRPIDGDVLSLHQRKDLPFLYDVKVEVAAPRATSDGPPQVATEQYRNGWDAIWGRDGRARPN